MSTRMIRTLAIAAGAGALVLSAAAPAMAADITTLPAKVELTNSQSVNVVLTQAGSCTPANWTWTARVVGQKAALTAPVTPGTPITCDEASGTATWTVTAANLSAAKKKKANAVVKFILTPTETYLVANPTAERMVKTLVVKVNPTKGKPAKP